MKKIIFIIMNVCSDLSMYGQSISPQTLNSTGTSSIAGNIHLEWSMGEMTAVQTLFSPNIILTQGLLQPITSITSPLPVTLLFFSGKIVNNQNHLTWATSQEINNHHFDVERSANGTVFQLLKQVSGAGNSSENRTYSLIDSLPYPITWYRLKQVDIDGNFSYSTIIRLQLNNQLTYSLYPNPTNGIINLSYKGHTQSLQVSITDVSGKLVFQKTFTSSGILPVDVHHLSKGSYFLKVREMRSEKIWSAQFIKQ